MKKTKFVSLLKTFSKQEIKDFEKFVSSSYFSHGRNLKPVWKLIKKYYPSFESPQLTSEKIFKKIYPEKKFEKKSEHILNVVLSELTTLAEKFLAFEVIQKDNSGYRMYSALSQSLKGRDLVNHRQNVILKNMDRINVMGPNNAFFIEMTDLNNELQELYFDSNRLKEGYECVNRLPLYMYGYLMRFIHKLVNDYNSLSSSYDFTARNMRFLEMSIRSFDPEVFESECYDDGIGTKELVLTYYYVVISQFQKDNEENLRTTISIYKKYFEKFHRGDKWVLFISIFNICINNSRSTNPDVRYRFSLMASNLIDLMIENGIYGPYEDLPANPWYFLSFFHCKRFILKSEDLKKFADMMIEKVQREHKEWVMEYSYAWIYFIAGNYHKTLECISKINTKHLLIKNNITKLKISSLFSMDCIEETSYNLDSYEHFVRKNTNLGGIDSIGDLLYVKSLQTLIKYRTNSVRLDDNLLNEIIEKNNSSSFNFWFKEETEKLKSKS